MATGLPLSPISPNDTSVTDGVCSEADCKSREQPAGTPPDLHASGSRPLDALGITFMEERVYRALLVQRMTAAQVVQELSISLELAEEVLGSIEGKGLATHSPTIPRLYIAAPPEFTIKSLIRHRQAMVEQASGAIPELKDLAEQTTRGQRHEQILELITNRANLRLVLSRMHSSVRREVLVFQRLPVLIPEVRQKEPVAKGVHVRTITDGECFEIPDMFSWVRSDVARGEEARTYSGLPFKMMIVDHSVGLLRLVSDPDAPALLVHGSALLEALCMLFELTWDRATPILPMQAGDARAWQARAHRTGTTDALISMLAAGLNDKVMVNELQVSAATLNRRIGELMKAYGTRSRFQLGWRLALDAARSDATSDKSTATTT